MEVLIAIGGVWLSLALAYFAWPLLRTGRPKPYRKERAPRTRIVSTSYLQNDVELAQRFQRQVEEAKAALENPPARRGPVVSETVPSSPEPLAVSPRPETPPSAERIVVTRPVAAETAPRQAEPARVAAATGVAGVNQEVDLLRAQVERLRTELVALSSTTPEPAQRFERPRLQRFPTGAYTYLPRTLRQHVREARGRRVGAGN